MKPNHLYRFGKFGDSSDNTYLVISNDKKHLQCQSKSKNNNSLCGRDSLDLPTLGMFTPELVFKGASFRPRHGSHQDGEIHRNRYTWAATHYRLMGRMAACNWLGKYGQQSICQNVFLDYTQVRIKAEAMTRQNYTRFCILLLGIQHEIVII